MGQDWVHVALAAVSRFVIAATVGPRTLEMAAELVASVAVLPGTLSKPLLVLIDNHLPYPQAILQVLGYKRHRRRRSGRGRRKHPDLKAPPQLLVGVVKKIRDARGNLTGVKTKALFGSAKRIQTMIRTLGLGQRINTAHIERCNGTLRTDQARLIRRTHALSRLRQTLQASLFLWRDVYNWTRAHASLQGRTPAMALGLTEQLWSVADYVRYPVHWSSWDQALLLENKQEAIRSALDPPKRPNPLPIF